MRSESGTVMKRRSGNVRSRERTNSSPRSVALVRSLLRRQVGVRHVIAGSLSALFVFLWVSAIGSASHAAVPAQPPQYPTSSGKDTYEYGYQRYTDEQKLGRDTWYFWTGGDEKFWRKMAAITDGNVDLMMYVDSRRHNRRFETLGAINHPRCKAATAPDQYGLWMDDCSEAEQVPQIPGKPAGIVGLRRFDNPRFDRAKWNLEAYLKDRKSIEPPYLVGMACGFCHVGFNPINPPADPNMATWGNLFP